MRKARETILALDPGLRELGFATLLGNELLDSGVLSLRHHPDASRLTKVRERLEQWIRAFDPAVIVHELVPSHPLDAGLPRLGRLIRRVAKRHGIELVTYSAKTARRTVVGDGWAGKADVARRLTGRYPELRVFRGQTRKWKDSHWQNMFDAIALALHHQYATHPPSRSRFSD